MKRITGHYIRRIGFSLLALSILVTALAVANWAQRPTALSSRSVYYDTFNERWLDPAKWLTGLDCGPLTLECVREIQNGQLRLAVRELGATNSDSGFQFADSVLYFSNPNAINSIASDITLRSFSGTSCSTNPASVTRTPTSLGGVYFNTGSGQQADDVGDMVFFLVDTNNPKTINVVNFSTSCSEAAWESRLTWAVTRWEPLSPSPLHGTRQITSLFLL